MYKGKLTSFEGLPKSGKEAKLLGESKYFTGKPCLCGHIAARYTKSGSCTDCHVILTAKHRRNPTAHAKETASNSYRKRCEEAPELLMWYSAKSRARKIDVPFLITPAHILEVWPINDLCPVLGIPLIHNIKGGCVHDSSPSLDRVIPELGYVRGNIIVMSQHANKIKSNETDPAVFRKVADWLESHLNKGN